MRRAFTVLEVVFVIIIIGILAVVTLPKFKKNNLLQIANQIVSHIRYTQHLAMFDDKFDPKKQYWYKELWQIRFFKKDTASKDGTEKWAYAIFSDKNNGSGYDGNPNATTGEVAIDPLTGKLISGGFTINYNNPKTYKPAAIGEEYDVTDVRFSDECSYRNSKRIVFDYVGRPLKGNPLNYTKAYDSSKIISNQCIITFCVHDNSCSENFKIAIEPGTGYTFVYSTSS